MSDLPDTDLPEVKTVADVMARWPSDAEFARSSGILPKHAQTMKTRGSIPPAYWMGIVQAAQRDQIKGITTDVLAAIAKARADQARAKRSTLEPAEART